MIENQNVSQNDSPNISDDCHCETNNWSDDIKIWRIWKSCDKTQSRSRAATMFHCHFIIEGLYHCIFLFHFLHLSRSIVKTFFNYNSIHHSLLFRVSFFDIILFKFTYTMKTISQYIELLSSPKSKS